VFIGSLFGDSQLIRLLPEKDEKGSHVEVLNAYTNLGPILDFVAVDLERQGQGQGQVVTCSGAYRDGTLRVVRFLSLPRSSFVGAQLLTALCVFPSQKRHRYQ
jgi:DNA damage-binding protein 1